ncbi:MAG: hypothetical protein HKN12_02360 [Gemmatimonadetes bacterium]|nr:hypothetical protein [Gemmatimonadota bacterium]
MIRRILLVASLLLLPPAGPGARAQVTTERIIQSINEPVYLTAPPGDARLFIVDRSGMIHLYKSGAVLARPFLDIQALVNSVAQEQGFLGLAFGPAYTTNGHFYVYYTGGTGAGKSVVQRYTVSADPDSADAASGHTILEITQPTDGHNGSTVDFGPDGFLYLSLGESNGQDRAQDPQDLLGKMLRIDVAGDDFPADSLRNYAIPPTNPFVGDPGTLDEIWALGLRNPYRWSFDPATDELYLADVGHNAWEEINVQPAGSPGGQNYGWPLMEGLACFAPPTGCDTGSLTHPVHVYPHVAPTCWSITGGFVYRGSAIPSLQGHYFFGDFCTGSLWTLRYDQGTVSDLVDRTTQMVPINGGFIWNVASFGRDGAGELYVMMYGTPGSVFRIIPDPAFVGAPEVAAAPEPVRIRAFPNPFRDHARLEIALDRRSPLQVSVHTADGRRIRSLHDAPAGPGRLALDWNGRDDRGHAQPAGVYFLRATAGERTLTERITVLR